MTNTDRSERSQRCWSEPSFSGRSNYCDLLINVCQLSLLLFPTLLICVHISYQFNKCNLSSSSLASCGDVSVPSPRPPVEGLKPVQKGAARERERGAEQHVGLLPAVGAVGPGGRMQQPGDSPQAGLFPTAFAWFSYLIYSVMFCLTVVPRHEMGSLIKVIIRFKVLWGFFGIRYFLIKDWLSDSAIITTFFQLF